MDNRNLINLQLLSKQPLSEPVGVLIDEIPNFKHALIDDTKQLIFIKMKQNDEIKIAIFTYDNYMNNWRRNYYGRGKSNNSNRKKIDSN